ncbi:hypothetical protein CDAR_570761 [Caerostris darwini]|uniref:Uncharacterized protein n=1 Tax=Caerostris darwini TaxID=1538125 RepID=A0AAV4QIM4_9ARAC|nr:hypothetical protein CDAR_570761 [Caerostris darwini]
MSMYWTTRKEIDTDERKKGGKKNPTMLCEDLYYKVSHSLVWISYTQTTIYAQKFGPSFHLQANFHKSVYVPETSQPYPKKPASNCIGPKGKKKVLHPIPPMQNWAKAKPKPKKVYSGKRERVCVVCGFERNSSSSVVFPSFGEGALFSSPFASRNKRKEGRKQVPNRKFLPSHLAFTRVSNNLDLWVPQGNKMGKDWAPIWMGKVDFLV